MFKQSILLLAIVVGSIVDAQTSQAGSKNQTRNGTNQETSRMSNATRQTNQSTTPSSQPQCLTIYSQADKAGLQSQYCVSQELTSYCTMWFTESACASESESDENLYWFLFELPRFVGKYVFLEPGECSNRLSIQSIGSILQCTTNDNQTLDCNFPTQPWAKFEEASTNYLRQLESKQREMQATEQALDDQRERERRPVVDPQEVLAGLSVRKARADSQSLNGGGGVIGA